MIFLSRSAYNLTNFTLHGHLKTYVTRDIQLLKVHLQPKSKYNFRSYCTRIEHRTDHKAIGFIGWFLLLVPVSTFCLGTWQVKRRKWKLELMDSLITKTRGTPVELPEDLTELANLEYRPVIVRGEFDHSKEFLLGPRSLLVHGDATSNSGLFAKGGTSGYLVITPFKLADKNLTILVQRGWVPSAQKNPSTRSKGQIKGEIELTGIVRLPEKRPPFVPESKPGSKIWHYRDTETMAVQVNCDPVFLDAIVETTVDGGPTGGQTRVSLRNEHLSYILTWYSLSAATSYMWYRYFVQKLPLK